MNFFLCVGEFKCLLQVLGYLDSLFDLVSDLPYFSMKFFIVCKLSDSQRCLVLLWKFEFFVVIFVVISVFWSALLLNSLVKCLLVCCA